MSDFWDFLGIVVYAIVAMFVLGRSRRDAEEAAQPPPVNLTPVDNLRAGFRPDGIWRDDGTQDDYDDGAKRADLERLERACPVSGPTIAETTSSCSNNLPTNPPIRIIPTSRPLHLGRHSRRAAGIPPCSSWTRARSERFRRWRTGLSASGCSV